MYSPTVYRRVSPGTIWRRAIRRVERRADALVQAAAARHVDYTLALALTSEGQLVREAARLSNRLASMSR